MERIRMDEELVWKTSGAAMPLQVRVLSFPLTGSMVKSAITHLS